LPHGRKGTRRRDYTASTTETKGDLRVTTVALGPDSDLKAAPGPVPDPETPEPFRPGAPTIVYRFLLSLPFHLRLPDGHYKGQRDANLGYRIAIGSRQTSLSADSVPSPAGVVFDVDSWKVAATKAVDVPGMRLRYTSMELVLAQKVESTDLDQEKRVEMLGAARKSAHVALNHFLDMYRFAFRDTSVRRLTWRELHAVRDGSPLLGFVTVYDADGALCGGGGQAAVYLDGDPIVVGEPAMPADDRLADFRGRLSQGVSPNPPRLLLLDAEARRTSEDPRGAIIDAAMAFDIAVEQVALNTLVNEGATREAAAEQIDGLPSSALVDRVLEPRCGLPADQIPDWRAWTPELRKLRNRVVHDGYTASDEEASAAIRGASIAVHCLLTMRTEVDPERQAPPPPRRRRPNTQ
jgi:hypothetical protein